MKAQMKDPDRVINLSLKYLKMSKSERICDLEPSLIGLGARMSKKEKSTSGEAMRL